MAVHYAECTKPAAAKLGCKMCSIDIGGGMSWQGPATPAQQAKLAGLCAEISAANAELEAKMPALVAEVMKDNAAKAEVLKQRAKTPQKGK